MNRFRTLLGLVSALAVGGCDNGPSLNVVPEPAGANCPTGGFRVEADGEIFYSCNGQATTETIAAGAEGNPCVGDALRVTVPLEDGTTRYAYVCQSTPVDPELLAAFTEPLTSEIADLRVECLCEADPMVQADCESQLELYQAIVPVVEGCSAQAITAAGPFPEADRAALDCYVAARKAVSDCLDAIPESECSMDIAMTVQACEDLEDAGPVCAEPSAELEQWYQRAQILSSFLGCAPFGGI